MKKTHCRRYQKSQKIVPTKSNRKRKKDRKIVWREWLIDPDPSSLGHGVPFYDRKRVRGHGLVGFVEGYTWLHENPIEVVVQCIKPDAVTKPRTLNAMKKKVEALLLAKKMLCGMITHRIEAVPNA